MNPFSLKGKKILVLTHKGADVDAISASSILLGSIFRCLSDSHVTFSREPLIRDLALLLSAFSSYG